MWKLRPGWFAAPSQEEITFFSDIKAFRIKSTPEKISEIFSLGHFSLPDDLQNSDQTLIKALNERGIITQMDVNAQDWKESLQSQYYLHVGLNPDTSSKKLKDSTVLILGLGGTGSVILEHLAPSGIGRFILVDDDIVENSNLERQLIYSIESIGKFKTDQASNYIISKNPKANIETYRERIENAETFSSLLDKTGKVDICAICIDYPPNQIFNITSRLLWKRNIPFIHGGVMVLSSFWGPLFSSQMGSPDPRNFSNWQSHDEKAPDAQPVKVCFSPFNSITAAHMTADIFHFLAGANELVDFENRTFLNFKTLSYNKISHEVGLQNRKSQS